jgi:sugar phosphate isomerase/epimerase
MEIYFHTIALEPARWTPQRVSQSLTTLLPDIARAGFRTLEIYEPHLREEALRPAIRESLEKNALKPEILSSYLDLASLAPGDLPAAVSDLEETLRYFGFPRLRLFPGSKISPADSAAVEAFAGRLASLASRLDGIEILLETHDGSIADDPNRIVELVKDLALPKVGLLFQPTVFEGEKACVQFAMQKEFIRHIHLQNRTPAGGFETLEKGVTPWSRILRDLPSGVSASLEFVPAGICPEDSFDLDVVLKQAMAEKAFVEGLFSA